MLLDSTGAACEHAGAVRPVLSWEWPSFCIGTAGIGFDFKLTAVETPDGFDAEFCCPSSPKKLAARTPPAINTAIATEKIPKRRFFFSCPASESSLLMDAPTGTAVKAAD